MEKWRGKEKNCALLIAKNCVLLFANTCALLIAKNCVLLFTDYNVPTNKLVDPMVYGVMVIINA